MWKLHEDSPARREMLQSLVFIHYLVVVNDGVRIRIAVKEQLMYFLNVSNLANV